ncbi:non-canonical purine NTP pyrophosphatase [Candidatus Uhrbacteria bacterium]|nr:non-canonical purine NTP pyrophosphatase [Candidatus Uhrbacteria bacterium]
MAPILLATTNKQKIERIRKLLKASGVGVEAKIPSDLGIEAIDVEEGSDLLENARAKARAYLGKTDLPILGTDTGFFLDGEILDPAMVKRNALQGKEEKTLTQKEVGQAMLEFYQELARKHGGKAEAYWKDVFALVMPDGTEKTAEDIREVVLTDEVHGEVNEFFPMRSLYYSKVTGRYACDASEEDELIELMPYTQALVGLLG